MEGGCPAGVSSACLLEGFPLNDHLSHQVGCRCLDGCDDQVVGDGKVLTRRTRGPPTQRRQRIAAQRQDVKGEGELTRGKRPAGIEGA